MGEAGANRPQSVIGKKNFDIFNTGLFGSDVDYGEVREDIDKKRCRAPSRQSEQTTSWARYMEMRSTSLIH